MWECEKCRKMNSGNFCNKCGAKKPIYKHSIQNHNSFVDPEPNGNSITPTIERKTRKYLNKKIKRICWIVEAILLATGLLVFIIRLNSLDSADIESVQSTSSTRNYENQSVQAATVAASSEKENSSAVPIMYPDPVSISLDYNQFYQCTVGDFNLNYPISEGDVSWFNTNEGTGLTCNQRGYVKAGNVQASPQQGYTLVSVQGTTSNGTMLQYDFKIGDGQAYIITRSSKVLDMQRGKHYPYLIEPGIEDCFGFTLRFSYNVPAGNYVKNIWSVWIRVNGDDWTEVGEIAVNEGENSEYVIRFDRAYTFTEIAVQHPIDYNDYKFTDTLSISNIIH